MKRIIITKENIEEIIGRQIDLRATEEEIAALNRWREASASNESYYQEIIRINGWYTDLPFSKVNVDQAWTRVKSQMDNTDSFVPKINSGIWIYLGYAASFTILIAAGIFLYRSNIFNLQPSRELVSNETTESFDLDDGSIVTLQPNGALNKISSEGREYNFSGTAQFEVEHDPEVPFIIHINEVRVKDLGTIYQVGAEPGSDTVFVKVTDGIVQFYTLSDEGIMLEKGEEGMFIRSTNRFYKRSIDATKSFLSTAFHDATLDLVIEYLSYSFRKTVIVENENIRKCNITVNFPKAPFEEVKEIIEETLNISITETDDSLFISGKGCQ